MAKRKPKWRCRSEEELVALGVAHASRKALYKNWSLYSSLYQRGLLQRVYSQLPPSRPGHKNRFSVKVPLFARLVGEALGFNTLKEFMEARNSTYDAGRRHGIDYVEVFENRDNPEYLRGLIKRMYQDTVAEASCTAT